MWVVETHEGEFVGDCGLTWQPVNGRRELEVGFHVRADRQGQGLATEAARAVVAHARAGLGLRRLVSIHVVGNEASARVMVKLGMTLERETVQPDTGRRVRVYAMDL